MNHEKVHSTISFRKGKTNSKFGSRLSFPLQRKPRMSAVRSQGNRKGGGISKRLAHDADTLTAPGPAHRAPRGRAEGPEAAPRAGMSARVRTAPRADERPPARPGVAPCGHASALPREEERNRVSCVSSTLLSPTPPAPCRRVHCAKDVASTSGWRLALKPGPSGPRWARAPSP